MDYSCIIHWLCWCAVACSVTAAPRPGIVRWVCSGPQSKLNYNNCNDLGEKGVEDEGCFYMQHFAQYRSCISECGGVVLGSIDEHRCNAYCEGFTDRNCLRSDQIPSPGTSTTSSTPTLTAEVTTALLIAQPSPTAAISRTIGDTPSWEIHLIIALAVSIALVVVIVGIVYYSRKKLRKDDEMEQDLTKNIDEEEHSTPAKHTATEEGNGNLRMLPATTPNNETGELEDYESDKVDP